MPTNNSRIYIDPINVSSELLNREGKEGCLCDTWTAEMDEDLKIKEETVRYYRCPLHHEKEQSLIPSPITIQNRST